ncbi:MAG: asparagine synthase-related protein [Pyrinomonadaceae bacterium]
MLDADRLKKQNLFNAEFVQKILKEHETNAANHHKQLWTLLVFQLWHDNFLNK